MNIRCLLDPETRLPHMLCDHGVTEREVEEILRTPVENWPGTRDSRILIGQTTAGRCLQVICVPDEDSDGVFVITAYPLARKPLAAYRRRQRGRKK